MTQPATGRKPKVLTVGPAKNGLGGISALMRVYAACYGNRFHYRALERRNGAPGSALVEAAALLSLPFYRMAGYNILHVQAEATSNFPKSARAVRWGHRLGFKTVFHCHSENFDQYMHDHAMRHAADVSHADAVILPTGKWEDFYKNEIGCRRVYGVPNIALDVKVVRNRTKRRPEEPLRLLYMGKIEEGKGIFDLLEALAPIADQYEGYLQLTVAGLGRTDDLIAAIDRLGLDRTVRYMGWVEEEDKDKLLRLNDILVLPSHAEGMPVGVLEAGVYNMPCIASRVGAIPDVIEHGVTGYLVEPGNVDELTEAILYYIEKPAEIPFQGNEARQRITRYFPAKIGKQLYAIYQDLLS